MCVQQKIGEYCSSRLAGEGVGERSDEKMSEGTCPQIPTGRFELARTGMGIAEWAEHKFAFEIGCVVGCQFCWARENAVRRKLIDSPAEWLLPRTNEKKVKKGWRKRDGVIMFPSTHNISPHNVENSIKILRSMLSPGNSVLVTIKPTFEIVQQLTEELSAFKLQILFRFGIETLNQKILSMWEPHGAAVSEWLASLRMAFQRGFRTSVSAEPLLGGIQQALILCDQVTPYVTDDIWIGYMRKAKQRVLTPTPEITAHLGDLLLYSDTMSLSFLALTRKNKKVKLKDSIVKSLERAMRAMRAREADES